MADISQLSHQRLRFIVANYLEEEELVQIDKAWELVKKVHGARKHFCGEWQIQHALQVAMTLATMKLDRDTILSGVLHGVLKDGCQLDELAEEFGAPVARIVAGCSKITNVHYNSKLAHQAGNVRKMLLAIADDIRVLLVKLADRLQDMSVLEAVDRDVQLEIARETMDLYAPLASRLGIDWMKRELEDLSFQFLYPDDYEALAARLENSLAERQTYVDEVIDILRKKLADNKIFPLRIFGRPKHLYSIYKKLKVQNIPLERVYDKVAFRIIVESVNECYEALGIIHGEWVPVPGRIKDFISVPKSNNYQSMHTTVSGPGDHFIEIQIRTEEMDRVAQEGVAAHWAYKEGEKVKSQDVKLFSELKNLVRSLHEVEDPREFLDHVRGELYEPEVYALTPNGEVKEFPIKSCPIDFAYAVHSEVGDRCAGAKVNGRLVPLKYQLQNGDIVEIITSQTQTPRRGWLEIVKTSRARARIRSWLRREEKEKTLKLGREICERELKKHNNSLKKLIKSGTIRHFLDALNCNSLEDMLAKVGGGAIPVLQFKNKLLVVMKQEPDLIAENDLLQEGEIHLGSPGGERKRDDGAIRIDGVDEMLVKISQCCNPVPGDPIVGFITMGRGVSIHKADCENLLHVDPQRKIDVSWSGMGGSKHRVELLINAENRRGMLADISAALSADNANIVEIVAHTTPVDTVDIRVVVEVENIEHLHVLLQHLRQMKGVIWVRRK